MIFLAITSYFGIGFACFLITLFVDRILRFNLFIVNWQGEKVRCGTLGFFLIIAWPILFPMLVIAGIALFIFWVCDSLVRRFAQ